jgi:outer membrane protein assembly factor BamB
MKGKKMQKSAFFAFLFVFSCLAIAALPAEEGNNAADWPCWRGAAGDGASKLTGIITDWSKGLKKVWTKKDLGGDKETEACWSAPAIAGDRLVVPARLGDTDIIYCFEASTGKPVWKQTYPARGTVDWGAGPRATPYIDGDRVYTYGALGHLACWEMKDGKSVWIRNAVAQEAGAVPKWGLSSSPLVDGNKLYVQVGGAAGTVAYDKTSGKPLWTSKTGAAGYASPVLTTLAGKSQLLVTDAETVLALDPETGKTIWQFARKSNHGMNCATPIVHGDTVLLASNIGTQLLKVGPNGAESIWNIETLERGRGPCHADPVISGNEVYEYTGFPNQDKTLRCLSLKDGKELWTSDQVGAGWLLPIDGYLTRMSHQPDKF